MTIICDKPKHLGPFKILFFKYLTSIYQEKAVRKKFLPSVCLLSAGDIGNRVVCVSSESASFLGSCTHKVLKMWFQVFYCYFSIQLVIFTFLEIKCFLHFWISVSVSLCVSVSPFFSEIIQFSGSFTSWEAY